MRTMVLEYESLHLPQKSANKCRFLYSSTMVRIWVMSKMLAFTPLGQRVPLGFSLPSSGSGRMALGIFWLVTELALEEEATEGAAV